MGRKRTGCWEDLSQCMAVLFAATIFLSTCQAKPSFVKPRMEENGAVFLYLRQFPQEAERITFRLEEISAMRPDGGTVPLPLHINELSGKVLNRERLLASGELPPGQYSGFSFRLKDAALKGEEDEVALLPGEETANTPVSFAVARGKAVVLSMQFHYRESVREGVRFTPFFSAAIPGKMPVGEIGLVTSRGANTVTMFDKISGKVVDVIPMGVSPSGIVVDPSARRAYVAISGEDAVEAIDLLEAAVIQRQRLTTGDNPLELALTSDGKTLLSANNGSNTVSFIDTSSLTETNRLQVGAGPQSLLLDRTGRRAYIFCTLSNTISVIDIGAGAVATTIATEAGPVRGQFDRAGNRLYVLHRDSPYLSVLDPVSLSVIRRINLGGGGIALKVDPRTDLVYLVRQYAEEVDIYDPLSLLPIDAMWAGGEASYMTIDGEGNKLLIVLPGKNRLRFVSLVGRRTAAEIDVAEDPYQAAILGEK